ncbi:MAG: 30S ribosome-binding factor RbfA [Myxococcales bacterium]|nr:30S ribosome-binding factor RbfA [Myxococcales bacterium]
MSTRLQRVEQTLRRALADILLRGDLRDPRLRDAAALSITAVRISPDLSAAQVYVDVLSDHVDRAAVLEGLNAGASAIRAQLGGRIRLKRTPRLRFLVDHSIEQGRRIEAVLAELREPTEPSDPSDHAQNAHAAQIRIEGDDADDADEREHGPEPEDPA